MRYLFGEELTYKKEYTEKSMRQNVGLNAL